MITPLIVEKIREYKTRNGEYWLSRLSDRTGLGTIAIENVFYQRKQKYKISTLDELYDYFKIEKDEWYKSNLKKWHQKPDSIIWSIFRAKRIEMWLSLHDAARENKIDERTIKRLESGDALPRFEQYTMKRLVNFYGFTDEEKITIWWWITITNDLMAIYKRTHHEHEDDLGKNHEQSTVEA